MVDAKFNKIETTFEHKFARDIIRFVLNEHMLGLNWTPTGIFSYQDTDSPFTPEFKDFVVKELDYNGHNIHLLYDIFFPDKSLVETNHYGGCWKIKSRFVRHSFDKKYFIKMCVVLANFAGLSYLYGARNAPSESYILLLICIRELKLFGKIDDDFWNTMQKWLERRGKMEDEFDYKNTVKDISEDEFSDSTESENESEDYNEHYIHLEST